MSYCALDDLLKQASEEDLIQLTDDGGLGKINADVAADAIAMADATIDGYLARRYAVPLNPVPALVQHLSVDIALYNLYCRRPGAMTDMRKDRYNAALQHLTDLSKGVAVLPPDAEAPAKLEDSAQAFANARIFDETGFTGY